GSTYSSPITCGCTCQKRRCSRPLTHGLPHGETGTPSALSCSNTSTEPGLRSAHTTSARTKCRLRLMIAAQLDLNRRTPAPDYSLSLRVSGKAAQGLCY